MKILDARALALADVKVIRFGRFRDQRGYFAEPFRRSDLQSSPHTPFLKGVEFVQANESFSRAGTIRGLHFQWHPYQGKLVRTLAGHLVDLVLDIRKGSPTFGKIIAYDMPARSREEDDEWIWVPPGFAHGTFFVKDSLIEYLCSGEYSPGCEGCITPLADDLDWSLCDPLLRDRYHAIAGANPLITEKDQNGQALGSWTKDPRSGHFFYERMRDLQFAGG